MTPPVRKRLPFLVALAMLTGAAGVTTRELGPQRFDQALERDRGVTSGELRADRPLVVPPARTERGVLSPRTDATADRLAIGFLRTRLVTGADLGRALEVAAPRAGSRFVTGSIGGMAAFAALYFAFLGWTLTLPGTIFRLRLADRCLTLRLPESGSTVILDGCAVELDLSRAWLFGIRRAGLAGAQVTLVLPDEHDSPRGYRERGRLTALQVWGGTWEDALRRAHALRLGALGIGVLLVLVLGFDVPLAW